MMEAAGWIIQPTPEHADLVIAYRESEIEDFAGEVPHILLHTYEPAFTYRVPRPHSVEGTQVHSFSLRLGQVPDVWRHFLWMGRFQHASPSQRGRSRAALLATNKQAGFKHIKERLTNVRYEIGKHGYERGFVDLYGIGWEPLPVRSESRFPAPGGLSRSQVKHGILQEYSFNICLENAHLQGFVTEKFWEAIRAGCLPIYFGSSWLDRIFPDHSYVDLRNFENIESLFETIESMKPREIERRVRSLQKSLLVLESENEGSKAAIQKEWTEQVIYYIEGLMDWETFDSSRWTKASTS